MTPGLSCLRTTEGEALPLELERWLGPTAPEDEAILRLAQPPVLDVGCGPGRHVLSLAGRGVLALGVEASAEAASIAQRRGAPVLHRSIFDRIPGTGRWGSALLLDGNVGIGGRPAVLLRRLRALLRPRGAVFAEVVAPGARGRSMTVRLEVGGASGAWFPWAIVGVDDVGPLAAGAGFASARTWKEGHRWFARFDAP
jgi:SAM-dependent methyltransferase